jgi:hypothetical protein
LGQTGQVIKRVIAGAIALALVGEQLLHTDALVCAGASVRDVSGVEQLDDVLARDVEDVGALLCGQLLADRHECEGVAARGPQ